jgi:hypothetical protein
MTIDDVRMFANVTTHWAEEAFRRQMEESDRRIEAHVKATRLRCPEKLETGSSVTTAVGRQLS